MERGAQVAALVFLASGCGSVSSPSADAAGDPTDAAATDADPGPPTFAVGGTVSGLDGTLTLTLASESLEIAQNGGFSFETRFEPRDVYEVRIGTQPAGQACVIAHETGTVAANDVTGVEVACYARFFEVTLTNDQPDASVGDGQCATSGNACTLRAAIMESSATGEDYLILLPAGTFALSIEGAGDDPAIGDLDVLGGGEVRVVGRGASSTVIDGGGTIGLFDVHTQNRLIVEKATLRNGSGLGGVLHVRTDASAVLRNVVVSSHSSAAPLRSLGDLEIVESRITGNDGSNGGALHVNNRLVVRDSLIDGNRSTARGGALFADGADVTIENSTFSGNTSNTATTSNGGGAMSISNSTVSLRHVTITGNSVMFGGRGGGVHVAGISTLTMIGTVVAGNSAPLANGSDCFFVSTPPELVTGGGNVVGIEDGCRPFGDTDRFGTVEEPLDPDLGPLTDLGRGPPGHLPQPQSPAVGAAGASACLTHDQVGEPRLKESGCDSGAIESP